MPRYSTAKLHKISDRLDEGAEAKVYKFRKHPLVFKVPYNYEGGPMTAFQRKRQFAMDFASHKILGDLAAPTYFDRKHGVEVQRYMPHHIENYRNGGRIGALDYIDKGLKKRGLMHTDLGSHNVRLDEHGVPKIVDFGGTWFVDDALRKFNQLIRRAGRGVGMTAKERARLSA